LDPAPPAGGATLGEVAVVGDYAYALEYKTLRVLDISNPAFPAEVGTLEGFGLGRGITISGDYAYVADQSFGLHVVDISNPGSPIEVGLLGSLGQAWDVAVSGNYAFVGDAGGSLRVVDITTPSLPSEVASLPMGSIRDVVIEGSYLYLAVRTSGLRIFDISNPITPVEVGFVNPGGVCVDIAILNDRAYMANETRGVFAIDISDPTMPVQVASFETGDSAYGVAVVGKTVYVADSGYGLWVLEDDLATPAFLISFSAKRWDGSAIIDCRFIENLGRDRLGIWRQENEGPLDYLGEFSQTDLSHYQFVDHSPPAGQVDYLLQVIAEDGSTQWLGQARLPAASVNAALILEPGRPNPFNPLTTLSYHLPTPGRVRLSIYDARGRHLVELAAQDETAGWHTREWNGTSDTGRAMPSGVYFAKIETPDGVRTRKLLLAR
jgi:hypothetical protein